MDLSYINTQSQIFNAEETTKREPTQVKISDPLKFRNKVDWLKHSFIKIHPILFIRIIWYVIKINNESYFFI